MQTNEIIKVMNLDFFYGKFQALKNINLTIQKNEVTAFIGPSGCGKSTLLRVLNRMNDLVPASHLIGKIIIEDRDIYSKDIDIDHLRSKVGMVFQKPNPFAKSIFDNIAYGLKIQGIKDKQFIEHKVVESLRQAALFDEVKDKLKQSAFNLSGGQQQRLCIARALAVSPKILLMDEPCSALDPISSAKIEELICHLKEDLTIVIVTHNMQQAKRISQKTAFFYLGELIECGPTEKIFSSPEKTLTSNYISGSFS